MPIKRHYPDHPLVGVGAVVFRGEEVLLVRRGQEPARDSWSIPGGLVELGESLEKALARELEEETGIQVKILGISAVLNRIYRDDSGGIPYHYVLVDFLCDYVSGELKAASDIRAARFVSLGELDTYDMPAFTLQVIRRAWEHRRHGTCLPRLP
jgi:8-oxo-dGTP diphosphatase